MKKLILLSILILLLSCKNNNDIVQEEDLVEDVAIEDIDTETPILSKSESDQKIIEICKNMDGIIDADIKDDILTLRGNISKVEAKKISDGMLEEINNYNDYIKTVILVDIDYQILSYSGK